MHDKASHLISYQNKFCKNNQTDRCCLFAKFINHKYGNKVVSMRTNEYFLIKVKFNLYDFECINKHDTCKIGKKIANSPLLPCCEIFHIPRVPFAGTES